MIDLTCPLLVFLAASAGGSPLPAPRCQPLIRGALWWIDPARDPQRLDATIEAMDGAGMNLLWLLNTAGLAADEGSDLLERLYTHADRRGWRVIIETSCVPDWYHHWDVPALVEASRRHVGNATRRYARHPSFFGWYINHEIYMEWDEKSRKIRALFAGIREVTRAATPLAKLTISPFFLADATGIRGAFRYATPAEYGEWWAQTLRESGIDVVMLQDSGAEHCECVTESQRVAFFSAMRQACDTAGAELWGNVETVEYRAKDWAEFARRYREHQAAGTPYPWSFDMRRNAWKLDLASRFGTNLVTWGWEFWNPVAPRSGQASDENYRAYRAYLGTHPATQPSSRPR